jgi:hypothetical protein
MGTNVSDKYITSIFRIMETAYPLELDLRLEYFEVSHPR